MYFIVCYQWWSPTRMETEEEFIVVSFYVFIGKEWSIFYSCRAFVWDCNVLEFVSIVWYLTKKF